MCLDASPRGVSFAVVRHTERSDSDFEAFDPAFPSDPTLSKRGKLNALKVGRELAKGMDAKGASMTVVCSPFIRCVQTGIEICKVFGCGMIIDQVWGEVMSPDLFGGDLTAKPHATRDIEALVTLARESSVEVKNAEQFLGETPVYPETVTNARSRYRQAFESSLAKAVSTRQGFIVVTHGEALPVCLSCFPNPPVLMGQVPYGAYVIGSLVAPDGTPRSRASSEGADLAAADSVAFSEFVKLEKLTLPLCPSSAISSPSDKSVKETVDCVVRRALGVNVEPEEVSPKTSRSSSNMDTFALFVPKESPTDAPDFRLAWKRASPTAGPGLAARRRLRQATMDLGGDFGNDFGSALATPTALVAAS
jgi:broad specificity phosphatase PhoE